MSIVLLLGLVFFAYLAIAAAAFFAQGQIIYHPFKRIVATPEDIGLEYQEVSEPTADHRKLVFWRIPNSNSKKVVAYFHGNADNISTNVGLYKQLHEIGATIIAVEYPGYGPAAGAPSEAAIDLDIEALSVWLRREYLADSVTVIAMGRSLGGAVAAKLAQAYPVRGLIIESSFSRMTDIAQQQFWFLPVSLLLRERYDTESIVSNLSIPILVIHSRDDEVVPFALGERLYRAAIGPKRFLEIEGGHNDGVHISESLLTRAYRDFLDSL